jgi:hypothetical protein
MQHNKRAAAAQGREARGPFLHMSTPARALACGRPSQDMLQRSPVQRHSTTTPKRNRFASPTCDVRFLERFPLSRTVPPQLFVRTELGRVAVLLRSAPIAPLMICGIRLTRSHTPLGLCARYLLRCSLRFYRISYREIVANCLRLGLLYVVVSYGGTSLEREQRVKESNTSADPCRSPAAGRALLYYYSRTLSRDSRY